jgi:2-oxo-3-hexenedioate decarboxylase
MATEAGELDSIATLLDRAALERTPVTQLGTRGYALTLAEAYAVQSGLLRLRAARGEALLGVKMGFTSQAKRAQMKIDDLIWGRLTDAMRVESGGRIALSRFIHPRVEPELAFLLKSPLSGAVSTAQARAAIEAVAPALEVVDSRYQDFRFSLADVIADNSSSAAFIIGAWRPPTQDIANLAIVMSCDGRPLETGSSSAIMGDPLLSLVAAARLAGESGLTLKPGWLIMAGGATAARPLQVNTRITVDVESLGRAQVDVVP